MQISPLDPRLLELLEVQREMIELNKASTIIRGVLPRASNVVIYLDHEINWRFKSIQQKRRELAGVTGGI